MSTFHLSTIFCPPFLASNLPIDRICASSNRTVALPEGRPVGPPDQYASPVDVCLVSAGCLRLVPSDKQFLAVADTAGLQLCSSTSLSG